MIHIPTLDDYVVANEGCWKIEQLGFFYYYPMCQLGIDSLSAMKSKCFLIFGMVVPWNKTNHFFHIKLKFFRVFLLPTCLQKDPT